MVMPHVGRAPSRLEVVKSQAVHALGDQDARRIETFKDGTLYVRPSGWQQLATWVVDFLVYLLGVAVGIVAASVPYSSGAIDDGQLALFLIAVLFLVPPLYGLCYGNGRALGAVLAGTRLVRVADGSPIGLKGPWAMTTRTALLPLLMIVLFAGALSGGGFSSPPGSPARTGINDRATRLLHAAGFRRLDDVRLPR
ncbi:RDD family protein [Saccharothrix isguenensis]